MPWEVSMQISAIAPLLVDSIYETTVLTKSNIFNKIFAKQCSVIDNGGYLPNFAFKTSSRINEVILSRDAILKVVNDLNPHKAHGTWIKMVQTCGDAIFKCAVMQLLPL